jgi:hypothetical protein
MTDTKVAATMTATPGAVAHSPMTGSRLAICAICSSIVASCCCATVSVSEASLQTVAGGKGADQQTMQAVPPVVEELANLFAAHRVVPFLGAGCSLGHVGVDWNALRDEMTAEIGIAESDPLKAASAFITARGREAFTAILESRLHVDAFDVNRGEVQLRLMGLNIPVMYTTNQDRVLELCYQHHGRKLTAVIGMEEIRTLNLREPVLYKYHGDLTQPDSIVFCTEDYALRGPASDHPLDIRLKSDALTKTFIFLGYSFNDPTVQALFAHLKALFGHSLPPSWLVQFNPKAGFGEQLARDYGVRAINCHELYPDASNDASAFFRLMRDLTSAVIAKKSAQELEEMFKPSVPRSVRVIARTDVETLAQALEHLPVDEAIRAFRGICDSASIPVEMQREIADMFVELCRKATEQGQMTDLNGAIFNLRLSDPSAAILALSACYATANLLPQQTGMLPSHMFHPHAHGYDDPVIRLFAIASAFQLLSDWGRTPSKGFYDWVSFMLNQPPCRAQMPPELCRAIDAVLNIHYARGKTTYEQPLDRADRLARLPGMGATPISSTFGTLYKNMSAMMPKATPRPYQS